MNPFLKYYVAMFVFFVVFGLLPRFLINRKFADKTIAQEVKHSIEARKKKMRKKIENRKNNDSK